MRIVFGVGIGEDKDGKPILPQIAAGRIQTAIEYLSRQFGGVFVVKGQGGWINDGKLIVEDGLQFIVERVEPCIDGLPSPSCCELIANVGESLRKLFDQTSVIVSISESATRFITKGD